MQNNALNNYLNRTFYTESTDVDSELLDELTLITKQLKLIYVKSRHARIDALRIGDEGNDIRYIIWDSNFWKLFREFVFISYEPKSNKEQDVNLLLESRGFACASICNYLSEKFDHPQVSKMLKDYSCSLGYKMLTDLLGLDPTYDIHELEETVRLSKIFVAYHEIAHVRFKENRRMYDDNAKKLMLNIKFNSQIGSSAVIDDKLFVDANNMLLSDSFSIKQKEELCADFYAFGTMKNLLTGNSGDEAIPDDKKALFSSLFISINALNRFIVIKSTIDNIWNRYLDIENNSGQRDRHFYAARHLVLMYSTGLFAMQLGSSYLGEVQKSNEYIDSIMDMVNKFLDPQSFLNNPNLEVIQRHISNLTVKETDKYLQFVFNKADIIKRHNPIEAIALFTEFIEANSVKNGEANRNVCDAYSTIARLKAEMGDFASATSNLNDAIRLLQYQDKSSLETAFLYNNIGNVYLSMQDGETALQYYFESARIRLSCGDINSLDIFMVYKNIAELSASLGAKTMYQSVEYAIRAFNIVRLRLSTVNDIFIEYINIIKSIINSIYAPSVYYRFCNESGEECLSENFINSVTDSLEHQNYIGELINEICEAENEESALLFLKLCEACHTLSNEDVKNKLLSYGYCNVRPKLIEIISSYLG